MKIHLITIVWGAEYTDLYVKVVIPNQLSSGNLPAIAKHGIVYKIYTTANDSKTIASSDGYKRLCQIVPAEIVLMDGPGVDGKYDRMTAYNRHAIAEAGKQGAALIFLPPDQIYSDGCFEKIVNLVLQGKRAVMVAALRITKETAMPYILEKFFSKTTGDISMSSREMVRLAMDHFHPISRALVWGPDKMIQWPSHIYFMVPEEGILSRCFHPFPLIVNPAAVNTTFSGTLDSDYLYKACPDISEIYFVTDSDEIMSVELDPEAMFPIVSMKKPDPFWVACWAKYNTDEHQRDFARSKLYYHFLDKMVLLQEAGNRSDEVLRKVFGWLRFEAFMVCPKYELRKFKDLVKKILQRIR